MRCFVICLGAAWLWLLSLAPAAATLNLDFVDETGKPVANTVVALIPALKPNFADKAKAIMDQRHNMFTPGVLAVRVNTLVYFPNGDNVRHHVYSFSPAKRFELRLYHGMTADPVLFDQPGQVVLGCNIHDSMVGYIYVVDSEYFGVDNTNGQLSLSSLPAGNYRLQVQNPKLLTAYPEQKITLTADQELNKKIVLSGFVEDKKEDTDSLDSLFK